MQLQRIVMDEQNPEHLNLRLPAFTNASAIIEEAQAIALDPIRAAHFVAEDLALAWQAGLENTDVEAVTANPADSAPETEPGTAENFTTAANGETPEPAAMQPISETPPKPQEFRPDSAMA
ncbi:MAG: hypothetical protein AAF569_07295 [Pseudomonadota bacterium]